MNKSSDPHNKLIRSLGRKPASASIAEASERVWSNLAKDTMLTPLPTRRFLNASPLITGVMAVALVALIASTSYLAVQQSKLRKEIADKDAVEQHNSVVILPDNGGQFFVPQATPASTATPNPKTTPPPPPANPARPAPTPIIYKKKTKKI
jgi:hypothetical protein